MAKTCNFGESPSEFCYFQFVRVTREYCELVKAKMDALILRGVGIILSFFVRYSKAVKCNIMVFEKISFQISLSIRVAVHSSLIVNKLWKE